MKTKFLVTVLILFIFINIGYVTEIYNASISGSLIKNQLDDSMTSYTTTKVILGILSRIVVYIKILLLIALAFLWKPSMINVYDKYLTAKFPEEK